MARKRASEPTAIPGPRNRLSANIHGDRSTTNQTRECRRRSPGLAGSQSSRKAWPRRGGGPCHGIQSCSVIAYAFPFGGVISSVTLTSHLPSGANGSSSEYRTRAVQLCRRSDRGACEIEAALVLVTLMDNAAAAMTSFMGLPVGCFPLMRTSTKLRAARRKIKWVCSRRASEVHDGIRPSCTRRLKQHARRHTSFIFQRRLRTLETSRQRHQGRQQRSGSGNIPILACESHLDLARMHRPTSMGRRR